MTDHDRRRTDGSIITRMTMQRITPTVSFVSVDSRFHHTPYNDATNSSKLSRLPIKQCYNVLHKTIFVPPWLVNVRTDIWFASPRRQCQCRRILPFLCKDNQISIIYQFLQSISSNPNFYFTHASKNQLSKSSFQFSKIIRSNNHRILSLLHSFGTLSFKFWLEYTRSFRNTFNSGSIALQC